MLTHSVQSHHANRITVIDALRGFTLLGIIITHMVEQYNAGAQPEIYAELTTVTVFDYIATGFAGLLITGKFYAIFSFLFGLSFFIQLSKNTTDLSFILKFTWRLLILFVIGFIHHIHYRGDILTIYAILGTVLLATYRLPNKMLFILSLLLIFDTPGIITRVIGVAFGEASGNVFTQQDQKELLTYYEIFKQGSYRELLKANIESFSTKMEFQLWSGRIYMTPGLFLLGLYIGRKKFFEDWSSKTRQIKKILSFAAWGLLGTVLLAIAFFFLGNAFGIRLSDDVNALAGLSFFNIFNTFLAVVYVTSFMLLFQKEKWHPWLMHFYSVGRMGLTTYLVQTIFGLLIYSTLGLGLLGDIGNAASFGIAIILFIFQVWAAKLWMRKFFYGPVEWLWRSLTHFKRQPFLRPRLDKSAITLS